MKLTLSLNAEFEFDLQSKCISGEGNEIGKDRAIR